MYIPKITISIFQFDPCDIMKNGNFELCSRSNEKRLRSSEEVIVIKALFCMLYCCCIYVNLFIHSDEEMFDYGDDEMSE